MQMCVCVRACVCIQAIHTRTHPNIYICKEVLEIYLMLSGRQDVIEAKVIPVFIFIQENGDDSSFFSGHFCFRCSMKLETFFS